MEEKGYMKIIGDYCEANGLFWHLQLVVSSLLTRYDLLISTNDINNATIVQTLSPQELKSMTAEQWITLLDDMKRRSTDG